MSSAHRRKFSCDFLVDYIALLIELYDIFIFVLIALAQRRNNLTRSFCQEAICKILCVASDERTDARRAGA